MSNLADFLLARIAEDEAVLERRSPNGESRGTGTIVYILNRWDHRRLERECQAKRLIVERLTDLASASDLDSYTGYDATLVDVLRAFAAPYADHPDYQEEWKFMSETPGAAECNCDRP